jgi:uncharacterized protein (UPF0335 family)
MSDIVKRHREAQKKGQWVDFSMTEAIEEIERLREENAKLKEEVDDLNNRLIEAAEMADYHD